MRPFQLLIKPVSARCNMHCTYCFYRRVEEMYPSNPPRMKDDVLEETIRNFLSYRLPVSVFSWQGGEPTVAGLDFFEKVVEFQKKHGEKGQVIGNSLQTNGVLIDEDWAKFLSRYKFLVGMSLDGPRELHNSFRRFSDDRDSFSSVMECAKLLKDNDVAFSVLCVVNSLNAEDGGKLYRWFIGNGFRNLQFIPCVEKGPETGRMTDYSVKPEQYGRFLIDVFDEWKKKDVGRVFVRTFDDMLNYLGNKHHVLCIFGKVCNDYLVVEHNGDVYPCDFFVRDELKLGNVMDAPLASFFETETSLDFASNKSCLTDVCTSCSWLEMCNGGCQKDRIGPDGQSSAHSYLCEGYKMFFVHSRKDLKKMRDRLIKAARKATTLRNVRMKDERS